MLFTNGLQKYVKKYSRLTNLTVRLYMLPCTPKWVPHLHETNLHAVSFALRHTFMRVDTMQKTCVLSKLICKPFFVSQDCQKCNQNN